MRAEVGRILLGTLFSGVVLAVFLYVGEFSVMGFVLILALVAGTGLQLYRLFTRDRAPVVQESTERTPRFVAPPPTYAPRMPQPGPTSAPPPAPLPPEPPTPPSPPFPTDGRTG